VTSVKAKGKSTKAKSRGSTSRALFFCALKVEKAKNGRGEEISKKGHVILKRLFCRWVQDLFVNVILNNIYESHYCLFYTTLSRNPMLAEVSLAGPRQLAGLTPLKQVQGFRMTPASISL